MENEQDVNQGTPEQSASSEDTNQDVTQQSSDQTGNPAETSKEQPSNDEGVYVDANGKRFISQETFDARLGKEVSKRKGFEELLDQVRSDPQARQEFLTSLGIDPSKSQEVKPPSKWDTFLEKSVEANYRPQYSQMYEAMTEEIERRLDEKIQRATMPMLNYVGEQEIKRLSFQYPDFKKHAPEVTKLVEQYGIPANIAYKAVAFDDNFSRGQKSAEKAPQRKASPTPGLGKPSQGGGSQDTNQKRSIRETMEYYAKKSGAGE